MVIPGANGALKAMPATAGYLAQTHAVDVVTSEKSNQHQTLRILLLPQSDPTMQR